MIVNPISYPGNKNRLLSQIIPEFPSDISTFVDVFAGSGVVAANSNAKKIICNDISAEAIAIFDYFYTNSFEKIVSDIENIIEKYGLTYSRTKEKGYYVEYKHEGLSLYNKEGFNALKADYNKDKSIDKLVVLLIYGFNHYIRFNKSGQYNVPVGKVDFSKSIYNNMETFVNHLKGLNIELLNYDFRSPELYKNKDAFYYFDPPYLTTTAPYNLSWNEEEEIALLSLLDDLNEKGYKFALSNVFLSNGKENHILIEWSKKYNVVYLKRQYRNANYQKVNITDTIEVLIKNY